MGRRARVRAHRRLPAADAAADRAAARGRARDLPNGRDAIRVSAWAARAAVQRAPISTCSRAQPGRSEVVNELKHAGGYEGRLLRDRRSGGDWRRPMCCAPQPATWRPDDDGGDRKRFAITDEIKDALQAGRKLLLLHETDEGICDKGDLRAVCDTSLAPTRRRRSCWHSASTPRSPSR